jgi:two-component system response regulator
MSENNAEVLLVEDNPSDVELVLKALKKHHLNINMHVARDGVEALDYIFARGDHNRRNIGDIPKVIFLDLKLPRMNGLEVLQQIKADERTKMVPIVVLTSSTDEQDVLESYQLGVNSYIVKPINFDKFVQDIVDTAIYWLTLNHAPALKYH